MALGFGFRRPAAPLTEQCDRCGAGALIRFTKNMLVVDDDGVGVRDLDLILCGYHRDRYSRNLYAQGFRPVEVLR